MMRRILLKSLTGKRVSKFLGRGSAKIVILCYHDVRDEDDFSSWLRVSANRFSEHLEALSAIGRFISPASLDSPSSLEPNQLHFLLTFDDGYPNNLRLAADRLERAAAPALFFISTHHMMTGEPFWFDRVVTRLQAACVERLDLSRFGMREYRFRRPDGAGRWDDIERLLADLKRLGNPTHPVVSSVLALLDSEYGQAAQPFDKFFRPIQLDELRNLSKRKGMTIGSHGHRHEILTLLPPGELDAAIRGSRTILEDAIALPIRDFAYPNGDADERVIANCQSAGYSRGYAASTAASSRGFGKWLLPRLLVGGYDTAADLIAGINGALIRGHVANQ